MASYEQNKTNRKWSVRFRSVEFGKVVNKRLSGFKTKKEAEQAYSNYKVKNLQLSKSDYFNLLFNDLYSNYLSYIENRLKVSSVYDIKHQAEKHILPNFGNMKVFKITKQDIFNWQNELNKQNYSYKYKSKLRGFLSAIFKYAIFYYDLPNNPVLQVEPFKRNEVKKEIEVWSKEEFTTFINCVDDFVFKTYFCFLYLTGCRKGEAFALSWDRIDFKKNTVTINKNLTRKVEGKPFAIIPTKTYETRTILIPISLVNMLIELRNNQDNYKTTNFVFGGDYPLADRTTTRVFDEVIKKAGVKKIHLHCLRHSHASLLISQGESIVMVSKRLGHASIEQTLNTYSHLMPNEEEKMVSKLNINITI